jgi:hypothetical protein
VARRGEVEVGAERQEVAHDGRAPIEGRKVQVSLAVVCGVWLEHGSAVLEMKKLNLAFEEVKFGICNAQEVSFPLIN